VRGVDGLERLNGLPEEAAVAELLAVCHSRRWAERVAAGRPYPDLEALQAAADQVWMVLGPADWLEAFKAHPRIGESGGRSEDWSRQEQAGAGGAGGEVRERLAAGNAEYERRFGHVFLISAAGRDVAEILDALQARLGNDPGTELRVAAGEHRRITRLRLEKLVRA
jgi:OHCU decarboxylase